MGSGAKPIVWGFHRTVIDSMSLISQRITINSFIESISNILKCCALIMLLNANVAPAYAVSILTKGGPKIRSDNGNFEIGINGRAHLDVHSFSGDKVNAAFPPFGSQLSGNQDHSGFDWRRTYATLTGRIYGLNFKFENDFAVSVFPESIRETWVSTRLGPGQITVGQFKPYRGMEELTSSNEITMMERPSTSSSGIYAGRQFLMGTGYRSTFGDKFGYGVDIMSLNHIGSPLTGLTYGGRVVWLPLAKEGNTLHFGFSYSVDDAARESLPAMAADVYGGRRGIGKSLGIAGTSAGSSGENSQTTFAAEAAYAIGPVTLQGEYANAKLTNTHLEAGAQKDSHVQAYYMQASWFVTGERTIYRKDRGAFGKPKPISKWGALEVAARYDLAENTDQSLSSDPCRTETSKCQVRVMTLGINWYVRQGLRFMLNYYLTEAAIGNPGAGTPDLKDTPSVISFRTQLSF